MPSYFSAKIAVFAGVIATASAAHADCVGARTSAAAPASPEAWQAALDDLIRATTEPGHPWSCSGGTVDLTPAAGGAVLVVARAGEAVVRRSVAAPEDVLPLGQALLAMPLATIADVPQPADAPVLADPPHETDGTQARAQDGEERVVESDAPVNPGVRRLLLSAGLDARGVGASRVAWLGPALSAALQMGHWLPLVTLRQASSVADGLAIDEYSVALGLQRRFELSKFELRTGLLLRGAVVQRDLPHGHGDQTRVDGRVGVLTSFVIPVVHWLNVVISADAELVAVSRTTAQLEVSNGADAVRAFPTYTLGGGVWLEVPL